jgi:hypothetical protein
MKVQGRLKIIIYIAISSLIILAFNTFFIGITKSQEESTPKFSVDLEKTRFDVDAFPGCVNTLLINGTVTLDNNWSFDSSFLIVELEINTSWNHTPPNDMLFQIGDTSHNFSFSLFVPPGGIHNWDTHVHYVRIVEVTGRWRSQTGHKSGDIEMDYTHIHPRQFFGISLDESEFEVKMKSGQKKQIQVNMSNAGNGYDKFNFQIDNEDTLHDNITVSYRRIDLGSNQDTFVMHHNSDFKVIVTFSTDPDSILPGEYEVNINISSMLSENSDNGPVHSQILVKLIIEDANTINGNGKTHNNFEDIFLIVLGFIVIAIMFAIVYIHRKQAGKDEKL